MCDAALWRGRGACLWAGEYCWFKGARCGATCSNRSGSSQIQNTWNSCYSGSCSSLLLGNCGVKMQRTKYVFSKA